MATELPNVLTAIMEQLKSLQEERASYVARVHEIDEKLSAIALQLGISADQIALESVDLPRLPLKVDQRRSNGLPEGILSILLKAEEPHTRASLKALLRQDERYAPTVNKNENTFYNAVKRYIGRGDIVEVNGYLYHKDRAPLPEGEDDPSGQHLPANVSSLFGPARRAVEVS